MVPSQTGCRDCHPRQNGWMCINVVHPVLIAKGCEATELVTKLWKRLKLARLKAAEKAGGRPPAFGQPRHGPSLQ